MVTILLCVPIVLSFSFRNNGAMDFWNQNPMKEIHHRISRGDSRSLDEDLGKDLHEFENLETTHWAPSLKVLKQLF